MISKKLEDTLSQNLTETSSNLSENQSRYLNSDINLKNQNLFSSSKLMSILDKKRNEKLSFKKHYFTNNEHSDLRKNLKKKFQNILVKEDKNFNEENSSKEEKNLKNKIDNRINKNYEWKNCLINLVTGKFNSQKLISYQNEYDFFTKISLSTQKEYNKISELNLNTRVYQNQKEKLYILTNSFVENLLNDLTKSVHYKKLIEQNDLFKKSKLKQRLLIENKDSIDSDYLKFIIKKKKIKFQPSSNIFFSFNDENNLSLEKKLSNSNIKKIENKINLNNNEFYSFNFIKFSLTILKSDFVLKEELLASNLISCFNSIKEVESSQIIKYLNSKIDKIKEKINLIKEKTSLYFNQNFNETNCELKNSQVLIKQASKEILKNYFKYLNFFYKKRDKFVQKLRVELFNLLKIWNQIKDIRNEQKFILTNVNLSFEEHNLKNEQDNEQYKLLVEERLNFEFEYFKIQNQEQNDSDSNEIDKSILKELQLKVEKLSFLTDGCLPGEPKFKNFSLTHDISLTPSDNLDKKIKEKLSNLNSISFALQLLNNDVVFFETEPFYLDVNLQIVFPKIDFDMVILLKDEITFQLVLQTKNKKIFSKNVLNLKNILVSSFLGYYFNEITFKTFGFETKLVINFFKNKININEKNNIVIGKEIVNRIHDEREKNKKFLNINDEFKLLIEIENELSEQKILKKLFELFHEKIIETNDQDMTPSLFCKREIKEKDLDQRLLILKERNDENLKSENLKLRKVPLYNSCYLPFILNQSWTKKITTNENFNLQNADLLKIHDSRRKTIIEHLIDFRYKLLNDKKFNENTKIYEDYVYEEIKTSLSSLNLDFLFSSKESKRPLRPNRKDRTKLCSNFQSLGNRTSTNKIIQIVVNVMHGLNIPVRHNLKNENNFDSKLNSISSNSNNNFKNFTNQINQLYNDEIQNYKSVDTNLNKNISLNFLIQEQKVSSFLEIVFQNQKKKTHTVIGNQPSWNETIKLDLIVPNNDYSTSNLMKIEDIIYLNLFDEIEIENNQKVNFKEKKYKKHYLGSINIPFSTLYLNGKIEGTICLNKPIYLTNYDYDERFTNSYLDNQESQINLQNTSALNKNTYLTIFITIDPQLSLPPKINIKTGTDEINSIFNYVKTWQSQLNKQFPNRPIKTLIVNLSTGKQVIATRFLSPIKPPEDYMKEFYKNNINLFQYKKVLMNNLAKYVSLIPLITTELIVSGYLDNIWCDCEQLMKMCLGTIEEHAILLCNYFLYLGLNCGLILGNGVPEGKTCYVIVWLDNLQNETKKMYQLQTNIQLWNPITGQCYYLDTDNFLPLLSVGCIITKENIFANIQKNDNPNQISFNLQKLSNWKPLFKNKNVKPLKTIQPKELVYEQIDEKYIHLLESQIEYYLKDCFIKWRKQKKTFFNRFCTKEIKKQISKAETFILERKNFRGNEKINEHLSTYQIDGILLNVPFNGINYLTDALYSTGIHLNTDEKNDFVIAVYLHAYPHNILSTYIYCAIVSRNIN